MNLADFCIAAGPESSNRVVAGCSVTQLSAGALKGRRVLEETRGG